MARQKESSLLRKDTVEVREAHYAKTIGQAGRDCLVIIWGLLKLGYHDTWIPRDERDLGSPTIAQRTLSKAHQNKLLQSAMVNCENKCKMEREHILQAYV